MPTIKMLAKSAVEDEKEGGDFYAKMLRLSPTPAQRSMIKEAFKDERKHLRYMKQIAKGASNAR